MKQWLSKQRLLRLLGLALGLAGGYAYYRLVGCATGTCPLTSNPWITTLWGGAIGWLLAGVIAPGCAQGGCREE